MVSNRVRELRKRMKFTQAELAKRAGTSQQHVQRIETRGPALRADLAASIAAALGEPTEDVFPALKAITLAQREKQRDRWLKQQPRPTPILWHSVYLRLRGGYEISVGVSEEEWANLKEVIFKYEGHANHPIVDFEADDRRYVLNLDHLLFAHFLFDGRAPAGEDDEEDETPHTVEVVMAGDPEPLVLVVEGDDADILDERAAPHLSQLQSAFYELVLSEEGFFNFIDEAGERAFFRVADIALASAPLKALGPQAVDDEEDGEDVG